MKRFLIFILILITHCSFDNKTGIWKNNNLDLKEKDRFKDFEKLFTEDKTFDSIIAPSGNLVLKINTIKNNSKWPDEFYQESNNLDNFSYSNLNNLVFKSKKLSRSTIKDRILFDKNNIILSDKKGNIIIYSIENESILYKYNFYKKKFKKIEKKLKFIVEEGILYVADNLGYLYAISIEKQNLIWAKNYKVPFRSNLKISKNYLLIANQDNNLYIVNKYTGERIKTIPTEEVTLKNDFINSLSLYKNYLLFLNTYGSLYSLRQENFRINWFVNLNQSIDTSPNSLFFSNPIIINDNKIIVSTDPYLYIIDLISGATIFKISITSIVKPVFSGNNIFIVTKDNLLVCIRADTGELAYSVDINQEIADFFDTKKKIVNIKSLSTINNNIFIFLKNSYVIKFDLKGKIDQINKLPAKLKSFPIFVNERILFLNKKNKLVIID